MLKKLLVVGGDGRMLRMAPMLAKEGYQVATLGLVAGDENEAGVASADALLFPYPFAVHEGRVPTLTGLSLHPEDVLESAKPGAVLLAGSGLEAYVMDGGALEKKFRLHTYMSNAAFLDRNADLSAEGAVAEAMGRTGYALMDMTVLVTGYGRFGRALAKRLKALGADVWVAARREAQRLTAMSDGLRAVSLEDAAQAAPEMDMVMNTIPARVIGAEALNALPEGAWLLELASAPYGFDREAARAIGLHTEVLPALPARYAPQSAARAMKQVCIRLLLEASK